MNFIIQVINVAGTFCYSWLHLILHFPAHTGTSLALFFLGKLAITVAFNSMYVFTAELFPTETRSSALAACSLVGRLGSILAPQTPLLVRTTFSFISRIIRLHVSNILVAFVAVTSVVS